MQTYLRYFLILLITFFFVGCANKTNTPSFVFSLSEAELNDSLQSSFPLEEDFIFGKLVVDTPKITMKKASKRMNIAVDLNLSTLFTPKQKGSFALSGIPKFNAKNRSIYLKEITIHTLSFSNMKLNKQLSNTFLKALNPMVNKAFEEFPIYTIPNDSFHRNRVKNIILEDGKLSITYGF